MRKHPILKTIYSMNVAEKQLAIVRLGQNDFPVKSASCTFFFDPYLSEFAEQWTWGRPKEIYGVDYVLCTDGLSLYF